MTAMRSLLAAAVCGRGRGRPLCRRPRRAPRRSTPHADTTIAAFAQDGALVAWFSPSTKALQHGPRASRSRTRLQGDAAAAGRRAQRHLPLGRRLAARRRSRSPARTSSGRCASSRRSRSTTSSARASASASARSGASRRSRTRTTAPGSGSAASPATGRRSSTASPSVDYVDEAGLPRRHGHVRARGRRRRRLPDVGAPGAEAHPRHGRGGAVEVAASGRRRRLRPGRRRRQAGPSARGRRPADRGRRRARPAPRSRASARRARRSRSRSRRTCSRRSSARRSALRLAWYDRATGAPAGSVPVSSKTEPGAHRDRPHDRLPRRPLDPRRRHRDRTTCAPLAHAAARADRARRSRAAASPGPRT